jgi:hypothetical protein
MSEPTPVIPEVIQEVAKAAKPKAEKVKEPTVEDLPFPEFMTQQYMPALTKAFLGAAIADLVLQLKGEQLCGTWQNNLRQFNLYFSRPDINSQKAFSCADGGLSPSTIEPFLIDERKATLDLMVFGVMQRLTAQKWLSAN